MSEMRHRMDRGLPESLVGPWACRSNDCQADAVWFVDLPAGMSTVGSRSKRVLDAWEGHFCQEHLVRALTLKLDEVPLGLSLRIRRIW